ncbi:MAG TPA: hypothetical protein VMP68_14535 [Candidatus Eisenbacteria bacterium]|nr:hypothetical protein [Candidatus Eisenbacteria bacterium]
MKKKKSKLMAADPVQELSDANEALEIMKANLRSATAELKKTGLMVTTVITDSNGKHTKVQRVSPMVKVQREALRTIGVLKRQIAQLQEEVKLVQQPKSAWDLLKDAGKVS